MKIQSFFYLQSDGLISYLVMVYQLNALLALILLQSNAKLDIASHRIVAIYFLKTVL